MTHDEPPDLELMHRTRRGDREAFAQLVRRHQNPLVNFFRRMGVLSGEAEDLVQETFLRVYAYRRRWRPTGKFTSFLYVLARHVWADMVRKSARTPRASEDAIAEATEPGKEATVDARMDVQHALLVLSDKLRAVVVLNLYQGLKYQEIADVLDIPLGTVKSRMHLALRQLKEVLDV